ncbi:hypothetical protein [Sporolactobacillus inulinus]|nr:hypothetical protein [Sporolactobacillus inulinus]
MSSYYDFQHHLALLKLNYPFKATVEKLPVTDSDIHESATGTEAWKNSWPRARSI